MLKKILLAGLVVFPFSVFAFTDSHDEQSGYFYHCQPKSFGERLYFNAVSDVILQGTVVGNEFKGIYTTTNIQPEQLIKGRISEPFSIKQLGCFTNSCGWGIVDAYPIPFLEGQSGLIYLEKYHDGSYVPVCPYWGPFQGGYLVKAYLNRIAARIALVFAVMLGMLLFVLIRKYKKHLDSRLHGNDISR